MWTLSTSVSDKQYGSVSKTNICSLTTDVFYLTNNLIQKTRDRCVLDDFEGVARLINKPYERSGQRFIDHDTRFNSDNWVSANVHQLRFKFAEICPSREIFMCFLVSVYEPGIAIDKKCVLLQFIQELIFWHRCILLVLNVGQECGEWGILSFF